MLADAVLIGTLAI